MKLIPFISKPTEPISSSASWPWPSCGSPKTLSFRAEKIMNSVFVASETRFINLDSSAAGIVNEEYSVEESIENVIRDVRSSSKRLFFDHKARETSSCIVGDQLQKIAKSDIGSKSSNVNDCFTTSSNTEKVVLIEMDSRDPFKDFKKSMGEMVEANGFNLKDDWEEIHGLLSWYLKVNDRSNHGYIVGAFVDLIISLQSSSFSSQSESSFRSCDEEDHNNTSSSSATVITQSPISALSFSSGYSTTPCLLTLFEEDEEEEAISLDHHRQEEKKSCRIQ